MANEIAPTLTPGVAYDDTGRAVRWLIEVLGLRVGKSWGPEDSPVFAFMIWKTGVVSVAVRPTDNAWSAVGPVSIDLLEPDEKAVEAAWARAVAAQADVVRPLGIERNPAIPDGYLGFILRDPEGNFWSMGTKGPAFDAE
jgi:uncharacterized glyoxalase superfamily protein PhnB